MRYFGVYQIHIKYDLARVKISIKILLKSSAKPDQKIINAPHLKLIAIQ